jgi:uncharacterized protein YjbI with pentapeptide repeats/beta-lactamase regulating signal transducer with metallopeptidase domain
MNQLDLVDSFAATVASALGFGILEAAAFAAVVFLLARMSRTSATTRHVLWWIALAAAAALPFASVAGSLGRIEHRARIASTTPSGFTDAGHSPTARTRSEETATIAHVPAFAADARPIDARPSVAAAQRPGEDGAESTGSFASAANVANAVVRQVLRAPHLATALVALWLVVAAAGLAMLARNLVSLARIKRVALPLDESVVRRLRRWRHSTRLGRAVELRVSNEVDVPVAVGFRTPTILLPVRVVEMEEIADLDQIAMHEYAHLDRYDDWTNLAQRVVERIFWFNPVVLVAGRQISLEREIACDDWVVAQTGRAHRYATCLWKLVESARFPMKPIVAPGALLSAKQITRRIEQLLDSRRNALPRLSPLGAIALGVLAVALVVVQAERAPVIAIEDAAPAARSVVAAAPAGATAPVPASAAVPAQAAAPVPLPSPAPERVRTARLPRESEQSIVLHVSRLATPEAIASELARTLSERDHDVVVKATVERAIRRDSDIAARVAPTTATARAASVRIDASAVASDGEKLGIDIAKNVATTVATSIVNGVVGGLWDDHAPDKLDRQTIERCLGCDLHGRDLRGIDLHGISLTGVDLHGADLRGVDLGAANLVGVDLRSARLDGANLKDARMSGCDLRGASLANADLDGLRLAGTSIRGSIVGGSRLRSIVDRCVGCDLRGLDLRGQDLHGIRLTGADMRAVDLRDADLSHAKFEGVDLRGARLEGANVDGASFVGCELEGVDRNALKGATQLDGDSHDPPDETQRLNQVPHAPNPPPSP